MFSSVCLCCELGVIVCSLLSIFSLQHPGSAASNHHQAHNRSRLALTFIFLATTVLAFAVTLFGVSKTLAAVRNAAKRISVAAESAASRSQH